MGLIFILLPLSTMFSELVGGEGKIDVPSTASIAESSQALILSI